MHADAKRERRYRTILLRPAEHGMSNSAVHPARDWLASSTAKALAWWLPLATMIAALFAPATFRAAIWIVALIWMGTACILNGRRCRRTHCRFTGPYFIAMCVPVLLLATGVTGDGGVLAWLVLGMIILTGGMLMWWASERAWGTFS